MKIIGTTATTDDQFQQIVVEAGSFPEGRKQLHAQVPEGTKLVSIRVERA